MSDYKLPGGQILPKDTIVVIPVSGIQKDKNFYPNPESFNPEHFSPERKNERNQYSYLSFGLGPRHCIGYYLIIIIIIFYPTGLLMYKKHRRLNS